jgi:hypothetical protein
MKLLEMFLFGPQTRVKPKNPKKHVEFLQVKMKTVLSAFLHTVFSARVTAAHFEPLT